MIKDKIPQIEKEEETIIIPEEVKLNPLIELYGAAKRAILTLREVSYDPKSPSFFKTIAIDNGQFGRIIRDSNMEMEVAFPAVFIRFINVRYLVQQQRLSEGRATMRIRFILNSLNNSDTETECDPFIVFQRLNVAIQDAKNHEQILQERCNLTYFDMPLTTNMLQAYWIDYEVWFKDSSAWKYRDWVERYVVMPPFTNHSDAPEHDIHSHGDHQKPTYEDTTCYTSLLTVNANAVDIINKRKEMDKKIEIINKEITTIKDEKNKIEEDVIELQNQAVRTSEGQTPHKIWSGTLAEYNALVESDKIDETTIYIAQ